MRVAAPRAPSSLCFGLLGITPPHGLRAHSTPASGFDVGGPCSRCRRTRERSLYLVRVSQESEDALQAGVRSNRIADREDEYHARRQRVLSPSRADAFALGDKTPDVSTRSYKDVMAEQQVLRSALLAACRAAHPGHPQSFADCGSCLSASVAAERRCH